MGTFDFISDTELRASLASDYSEMRSCLSASAWKAATVLAGSIVEALLADHLLTAEDGAYTKEKVYGMALGDLVKAAKGTKTLAEKTAALASAVKEYRNLIHPGRMIRLKEVVQEPDARVASEVVDLIIRDVGRAREQACGPTATSVVLKLTCDPSATAILDDLLGDIRADELVQLLTVDLPRAFAETSEREEYDEEYSGRELLSAIRRAYRVAFEKAAAEIRARVMANVASTVRTESETVVNDLLDHLVTPADLVHATDRDAKVIAVRMYALLDDSIEARRAPILPGLLTLGLLTEGQIDEGMPRLARMLWGNTSGAEHEMVRRAAISFHTGLPDAETKETFRKLLLHHSAFYAEKGAKRQAASIDDVITVIAPSTIWGDEDIPF